MKIEHPETYCWYAFSAYDSNHKWCCCAGGLGDYTNFQALNESTEIQEVRDALKNGQRHPKCRLCWIPEDNGDISTRLISNQHISKTMEPGTWYDPKLRYLWLDSGSVCNLACRTCGSNWSSSHYREFRDRYGTIPISSIQKTDMENLLSEDYSLLTGITVIGGEPFLNLEHLAVLEKISTYENSKNVLVLYHTNGTLPIPEKLALLAPKFASITIKVSVDAVGSPFDYIRTNATWSQVNANIKSMQNTNIPNVFFMFNVVVSVLNVMYLDPLLEWISSRMPPEVGKTVNDWPPEILAHARIATLRNKFHVTLVSLVGPEYYGFSIFTPSQRAKLVQHLESSEFELSSIVSQIQSLEYSESDANKFWEEVDWTKQYKGLDIDQYLPDLVELLQS